MQYQTRIFKQLQEDSQQLNSILLRSNYQDLTKSGGILGDQNLIGNRYLGFSYSYGQRTGGALSAAGDKTQASGAGRSINQIYEDLKQKQGQNAMKMDQAAESESKAFFQSKNVDVQSLEYSLKQAQNSFTDYKSKYAQQVQKPQGAQQPPSQLLATYTGATKEKAFTLNTKEFKQQLTSHIYQGGNLTKGQLRKDFNNKISNALKATADKFQFKDSRFEVPPLRNYYQVKYSGLRDEERKEVNGVEKIIIQRKEDQNIIRDIQSKAADQVLLKSLMSVNEERKQNIIEVKYDEKYRKEKLHSMIGQGNILDPRVRPSYEYYSKIFKKYTEENKYSGLKNVKGFCQNLYQYEDEVKRVYSREPLLQEAHLYLQDILELLMFFGDRLQMNEFTQKDKVLFSKNYQRTIASIGAQYLEQDFQKALRNYAESLDTHSIYENFLGDLHRQNDPDMRIQMKKCAIFDDQANTFPFGVAFFMFRSGIHKTAIEYLRRFDNSAMKDFADLYDEYITKYNQNVPPSQILNFQSKGQDIPGVDWYKDALIHLMTGNLYQPPNESTFYEKMLPCELETQLWMKLKFASYNKKEERSEFILDNKLPSSYNKYSLKKIHHYITVDLGLEHFTGDMGVITYFKVLMLIGAYNEALEQLYKIDIFRIQGAYISIILNEMGLLRTRYQFLDFIQQSNKQGLDIGKKKSPELLAHLLSNCYDFNYHLLEMTQWVENTEDYVTEAISLQLFLEDRELILISLAHYLLKGKLFSLLLESNKQQSFLNYESNTNLTLRIILGEDMFLELINKVVQYNEEDEPMNVMLLDKINKHEEVLLYLIKLQKAEILRNLPQYFVTGNKSSDDFIMHLKEPKRMMVLVTKEQARLLNEYEKQNMKRKFEGLYKTIDQLENIAIGYNKVWENKYEEAIKEFSQLSFLPMKRADNPVQKVREYPYLEETVKDLMLNVVITMAKLILHVHFKIFNDTNKFTDISNQAELLKRRLEEYKESLNKLIVFLEALMASNQVDQNKKNRVLEVTNECKKIQIEII